MLRTDHTHKPFFLKKPSDDHCVSNEYQHRDIETTENVLDGHDNAFEGLPVETRPWHCTRRFRRLHFVVKFLHCS